MKSLIGDTWMDAKSGEVIKVYNPATNELIDTVPSNTKEEVNEAVEYAYKNQKLWASKSVTERCDILTKFAKLVLDDKDSLAKLLSDETGKPIKEAIHEIANVQIGIPTFIEKVKHEYGDMIYRGNEMGQENTISYTIREPLGVVAVIIPFNFPSDIFIEKVSPALLMGNAVVLKPASVCPLTLTRYVQLLVRAGVPEGVISIVHGAGDVVGDALTRNKLVSMVSFTGRNETGVEVARNCVEHNVKCSLELGGNDAFILDHDGDIDLAIQETVLGRLYNTGQGCRSSKRFLIHNSLKDEFIRKMIDSIKKLQVGMPSDPNVDMGCLISEEAAKKVEFQVNDTVYEGAELVFGGRRKGAFFEPTILDGVTKNMKIAKDMEILGPVIPIIGFDNLDDAIEIANGSIYGLSGSIITKDISKAIKISEKMECGGVVINGSSIFSSFEQRYCGWKHSGNCNEGVMTPLKEMSKVKTVILKNITK